VPDPLRTTFDEVAEGYDRARPTYPEPVFDDLVELTGLGPGARLLEIGCGTGQATLTLAARGFLVTCVELGGRLAAVARRKLAPFPGVEIVNAEFETWAAPAGRFDGVAAFSAFHWIDPEVRYEKAAAVLREDGALAVVGTTHVLPANGDVFFAEVQEDYDAVDPREDNVPPPDPAAVADDAIPELIAQIESSGRFGPVAVRRHLWELAYTADEYLAVLDTYSGHRALDPERRAQLYERIHRRIEARPGGTVRKTYLALLNVARRL
jgi:SAM-dependent methyltransferase